MANYMAEVAKMLGVELGEYFLVEGFNGEYYLHQNGLYRRDDTLAFDSTLCDILAGNMTIKRKPWKPKHNEMYYNVESDGSIDVSPWGSSSCNLNYYKLGNCYRTKEEAEANRDKWIAFYASDEILEV